MVLSKAKPGTKLYGGKALALAFGNKIEEAAYVLMEVSERGDF